MIIKCKSESYSDCDIVIFLLVTEEEEKRLRCEIQGICCQTNDICNDIYPYGILLLLSLSCTPLSKHLIEFDVSSPLFEGMQMNHASFLTQLRDFFSV